MFACDECGRTFASVIHARAHGVKSCSDLSLAANLSSASSYAVVNTPASNSPFVDISHDDDFVLGVGAYFAFFFNYQIIRIVIFKGQSVTLEKVQVKAHETVLS